MSKGLK